MVANSNNWNVFVYVLTKIFLFFFPFFRFPIPKRPLTLFFPEVDLKNPNPRALCVCHTRFAFLIYGNESKMSQTRQPFSFLSTSLTPDPCSPLVEKQKMLLSIYLISLSNSNGRSFIGRAEQVGCSRDYLRTMVSSILTLFRLDAWCSRLPPHTTCSAESTPFFDYYYILSFSPSLTNSSSSFTCLPSSFSPTTTTTTTTTPKEKFPLTCVCVCVPSVRPSLWWRWCCVDLQFDSGRRAGV